MREERYLLLCILYRLLAATAVNVEPSNERQFNKELQKICAQSTVGLAQREIRKCKSFVIETRQRRHIETRDTEISMDLLCARTPCTYMSAQINYTIEGVKICRSRR